MGAQTEGEGSPATMPEKEIAKSGSRYEADASELAALRAEVERLREALRTIEAKVIALPLREERIGGQRAYYVQRDNVLALFEALAPHQEGTP